MLGYADGPVAASAWNAAPALPSVLPPKFVQLALILIVTGESKSDSQISIAN